MTYPISKDEGIQMMFRCLSSDTQKVILEQRNQVRALRSGEVGIKEYLHLISNSEEGIILA